ncbi:MAG: orotidine 5'-phosphate decarboxylase [Omnitrophica WOR_2 bacterium SM23_29]|nr:MAG: orotidine 5'-phosphate decarboxylase [Omnitrophica WOR_2 bacterium SM23_29]
MSKGLIEEDRLIVALDVQSLGEAEGLINRLIPAVKIFKVGLGLFTLYGPKAVELVQRKGGKVFLDLKFHDIPNTVANSVKSAARLGVSMIDLHTLGGLEMMRQAVLTAKYEAERLKLDKPKILGVTVLTSLSEGDVKEIGIGRKLDEEVLHLARMAKQARLDGVVASPKEVSLIRKRFGRDFIIVTPGIRPAWAKSKGDQKRIMTPKEAVKAGADYIVVGRPIIEAKNPLKAAKKIIEEIRS